jgi:hypothetical protein
MIFTKTQPNAFNFYIVAKKIEHFKWVKFLVKNIDQKLTDIINYIFKKKGEYSMPNNNFSEPNIVTMLELFIYLLCLVHLFLLQSQFLWVPTVPLFSSTCSFISM